MATLTAGTATTTNLVALQYPSFSRTTFSEADIAAINALIINDQDPALVWPGAFTRGGLLFIPNRGVLKMLPGDWVAVTPEGWPILLTDNVLATTSALTGTDVINTNILTVTTSANVAGWSIGGIVAGTGIPAATKITNISTDGLTITMSANATSSNAGTAITFGSFVHS